MRDFYMCEYMELQLCFERGFICVLHVNPSKKKCCIVLSQITNNCQFLFGFCVIYIVFHSRVEWKCPRQHERIDKIQKNIGKFAFRKQWKLASRKCVSMTLFDFFQVDSLMNGILWNRIFYWQKNTQTLTNELKMRK